MVSSVAELIDDRAGARDLEKNSSGTSQSTT